MRRVRSSVALGSWIAACVLAASQPGCSDSCEDLVEVCEQCTDLTYRRSCAEIVQNDVQATCSAERANFDTFCPPIGAGGAGAVTTGSGSSDGGENAGGAPGSGGSPAADGGGGAAGGTTLATGGSGG